MAQVAVDKFVGSSWSRWVTGALCSGGEIPGLQRVVLFRWRFSEAAEGLARVGRVAAVCSGKIPLH